MAESTNCQKEKRDSIPCYAAVKSDHTDEVYYQMASLFQAVTGGSPSQFSEWMARMVTSRSKKKPGKFYTDNLWTIG